MTPAEAILPPCDPAANGEGAVVPAPSPVLPVMT